MEIALIATAATFSQFLALGSLYYMSPPSRSPDLSGDSSPSVDDVECNSPPINYLVRSESEPLINTRRSLFAYELRQAVKQIRKFRLDNKREISKRLISEFNYIKRNLNNIHILQPVDSRSYNIPVIPYLKNNGETLLRRHAMQIQVRQSRNKKNMLRARKSSMRYIALTCGAEIKQKAGQIELDYMMRRFNQYIFKSVVLPCIYEQWRIIKSLKVRTIMMVSLLIPAAFNRNFIYQRERMESSPMFQMDKTPLLERFRQKKSPMRNFINRELQNAINMNTYKRTMRALSPMRRFVADKKEEIKERNSFREVKIRNRKLISDAVKLNNEQPCFYTHGEIMSDVVCLENTHNTTIYVTGENEDCYTKTLFIGKEKSIKIGLISELRNKTRKEYITKALEYKNASIRTNTNGVRLITKESSHLISDMVFVKRDHSKFTHSLYSKCITVMNRLCKDKKYLVGFLDEWLGEKMHITVVSDKVSDPEKFRYLVTDIIMQINMLRSVIFASSVIDVEWFRCKDVDLVASSSD